MKKKVVFKGAEAVYQDTGVGDVLFLLHGYLENRDIWSEFIPLLKPKFRIIALDIPGHGESGKWGNKHAMDDLASLVMFIINHEKIEKIFLAGHSMGGYITMAFAELYRERLKGYILFHSTCFADSEEKRLNREREISLVKCGKKNQIINVNIPKGFASDNVKRLKASITWAKSIARDCDEDGIIALLNGIKERTDRSHVLAMPDVPVLLIGGKKDNYIAVEVFRKMSEIASHAAVVLLEDSGHMGFIEEPEISAEKIIVWAGK